MKFPRNYSVKLFICGKTEWGWPFVAFLAAASSLYVGGGAAWGKRTGRGGGGSTLSAHPHYSSWGEVGLLCKDGVAYGKGRVGMAVVVGTGGGGGGSGGVDRGRLLGESTPDGSSKERRGKSSGSGGSGGDGKHKKSGKG